MSTDDLNPEDLDINIPVRPLELDQLGAVIEAIRCLEEVRTGSDFEVECWSTAYKLRHLFQIPPS